MKKIFLIISLFTFTAIYSQKTYEFDYLVEYKLNIYKDSIRIKNHHYYDKDIEVQKYYLTDSKNNDYLAIITEKDSLNYRMIFKDNYNGIHSNVIFLKSDLNKAEFINIKCENIIQYSNPYKYETRHNDFFIINDTIINEKPYSRYKYASTKPKRAKRRKLGIEYYIIDKSTNFHSPILKSPIAYDEWKLNKNLPNGIIAERYYTNYYGKISFTEKLIKYSKIDKKIIIPKDCDYKDMFIHNNE